MNMRENDLKKMCPQMLMEFYEDNDMEIWSLMIFFI